MWAIKNHKISKKWFSDPCLRAVSSSVTNAYLHISPTLSAHKLRITDSHTVSSEIRRFLYKGPGPIHTPTQLKGNSEVTAFSQICPNFMILLALDPTCRGVTANPTSTWHCRGDGVEVSVVFH